MKSFILSIFMTLISPVFALNAAPNDSASHNLTAANLKPALDGQIEIKTPEAFLAAQHMEIQIGSQTFHLPPNTMARTVLIDHNQLIWETKWREYNTLMQFQLTFKRDNTHWWIEHMRATGGQNDNQWVSFAPPPIKIPHGKELRKTIRVPDLTGNNRLYIDTGIILPFTAHYQSYLTKTCGAEKPITQWRTSDIPLDSDPLFEAIAELNNRQVDQHLWGAYIVDSCFVKTSIRYQLNNIPPAFRSHYQKILTGQFPPHAAFELVSGKNEKTGNQFHLVRLAVTPNNMLFGFSLEIGRDKRR